MNIVDVMHKHSTEVYKSKKSTLFEKDGLFNDHGEVKDLLSLCMKANNSLLPEDRLPEDELLSETNTILFAGTDTTSSALSRILLVLAENPEKQEKLRKEIIDSGELSFDKLISLPYLDAVCKETLRLYPTVRYVMRESRADARVPLGSPIRGQDGKDISEIYIPKDCTIIINISGVNRDPHTWGPDCLEWKPERWISGLSETVRNAQIPSVFGNTMSFLAGARSCIGFKFAELEMKTVLSQLIPYFQLLPSKDKEVIWRTGVIMSPTIKGSQSIHPQLPLRLLPFEPGYDQ